MITAAFTGFFTSISLILAIGAQNAFVLRQGLIKSHVFALCLFCGLSDAILIALGVIGFGYIVDLAPWLPSTMALLGAIFLFIYGLTRFIAARRGDYEMVLRGDTASLWKILTIAFAFTWLNPHVYLDTLGLVGAVSTQFVDFNQKLAFGIAAISASFVFFFSLGYGAALLAPIMKTARTWQVLDVLIGIVMWVLALGLILSLI